MKKLEAKTARALQIMARPSPTESELAEGQRLFADPFVRQEVWKALLKMLSDAVEQDLFSGAIATAITVELCSKHRQSRSALCHQVE
jgi:hypothetical protein